MWWPDKAPPGKRRGKVLATLSNRRAGPLQSPAFWFDRIRELQLPLGVLVPSAYLPRDRPWHSTVAGLNRVFEKPVYLSKEAGFREDRRTQRRDAGCAFEASSVRDPEA